MPQPSRPRPSASDSSNYEWTCPGCGKKYLAKSSTCPTCLESGTRGDELTKKTIDDNDLKKGW